MRSVHVSVIIPVHIQEQLVSGASLVISAGTTAGIEALIQNKHVIELGTRPPYFNFDKPQVK